MPLYSWLWRFLLSDFGKARRVAQSQVVVNQPSQVLTDPTPTPAFPRGAVLLQQLHHMRFQAYHRIRIASSGQSKPPPEQIFASRLN